VWSIWIFVTLCVDPSSWYTKYIVCTVLYIYIYYTICCGFIAIIVIVCIVELWATGSNSGAVQKSRRKRFPNIIEILSYIGTSRALNMDKLARTLDVGCKVVEGRAGYRFSNGFSCGKDTNKRTNDALSSTA